MAAAGHTGPGRPRFTGRDGEARAGRGPCLLSRAGRDLGSRVPGSWLLSVLAPEPRLGVQVTFGGPAPATLLGPWAVGRARSPAPAGRRDAHKLLRNGRLDGVGRRVPAVADPLRRLQEAGLTSGAPSGSRAPRCGGRGALPHQTAFPRPRSRPRGGALSVPMPVAAEARGREGAAPGAPRSRARRLRTLGRCGGC